MLDLAHAIREHILTRTKSAMGLSLNHALCSLRDGSNCVIDSARNLLPAKTVSTRNAANTASCATKGASFLCWSGRPEHTDGKIKDQSKLEPVHIAVVPLE